MMTHPDMEARLEAARLYDLWQAADDKLEQARGSSEMSEADFETLEKKELDAWMAYSDQPLRLMTDENLRIERCAISGLPLISGEELAFVLRSAVNAHEDSETRPEMVGVAG
jgi:hypothetical protein